ncbi:MAG: energy transducer TonB [Gammaproteobacteria bacterium]
MTAGYAAAQVGTVFNYVPGKRSPLDELAHQHFGKSYKVVDVGERERLVFPKGPGSVSPSPVYVRGRCLEGDVTVLYIIDVRGSVVSPHVAKTDNAILSQPALEKMREQRFEPAKVDGKHASMLAVTNLQFKCPTRDKA